MIIWQTSCHSRTLLELAAAMRKLPGSWKSPYRFWGTMDDHVWVASPLGLGNGGGNLFFRSEQVEVNMNGRTVIKGALQLTAWAVYGMRSTFGADPMLCLARYVGYAYHVRQQTYLLPGSVPLYV